MHAKPDIMAWHDNPVTCNIHLMAHWYFRWRHKQSILEENKLNIQLLVCELDYILLIFCMGCLFHRTHVSQMTCCGKQNNLLWPLVVKSVVLLLRVMSEGKQSILKKSLWTHCFALTSHTVHMSIWYMKCQCIMLYLQMVACNWCNNCIFVSSFLKRVYLHFQPFSDRFD